MESQNWVNSHLMISLSSVCIIFFNLIKDIMYYKLVNFLEYLTYVLKPFSVLFPSKFSSLPFEYSPAQLA